MTANIKQQLHYAAQGVKRNTEGTSVLNPIATGDYKGPGRLGDPLMEVKDDPRIDPRLLAAMSPLGMDHLATPPGLDKLRDDSTLDDCGPFCQTLEEGFMQLYNNIPLDLASDKDEQAVDQTIRVIPGGDGQDMKVYMYRPANHEGDERLPAVVYCHGGGMVVLSTFNPVHDRWCRSLAARGIVVLMPDFRNAWTKEAWHHFPAGLNDCAAAVRWAHASKDALQIGQIVVHGESGGGNLTLATALKAKREGWGHEIDGVFALCPAVSNLYSVPDERKVRELPSLVENHGYLINPFAMAFMSYVYTPNDEDFVDNPLAWPAHATLEDMRGLPPHVLVMDELDPLRDEGVLYAKRLIGAGVATKSSVNVGTLHATSLIFRQAMPDVNRGVAREVVAFAKEL